MPADIFDPAELETEELLPPVKTPENAHRADTLGDPEGSEARATEVAIALPDFFFRRYRLDDLGKPTFNKATVDGIMAVYAQKVKILMQKRNTSINKLMTLLQESVNF